ncbi:hypothetical protein DSO57_1014377 [Entomophthora muscae]|uniref:Uncharacterized protein n=1 Tax=Entomophthora muscae TaxID=34485 RepID=A0ACC2SUK9_9FUNG|nr:hypothetical protein DSO57_1014377 [Entomophthora muscae]
MQISSLKLLRPSFIRLISTAALPKTFSRPVTIPNDAYLLSSMVEELANSERLNDAIVLMFEATKKFEQPIVPWNILFTHVTKQKKLKLAIKLFNEMKVRGVKPNERTYTILLSGCANSPAPTAPLKAEKLLEEMKRVAGNKAMGSARPFVPKLEEPDQTTQFIHGNPPVSEVKDPSTIHYNNLLKVYSRQKKFIDMIKLYDSIVQPH